MCHLPHLARPLVFASLVLATVPACSTAKKNPSIPSSPSTPAARNETDQVIHDLLADLASPDQQTTTANPRHPKSERNQPDTFDDDRADLLRLAPSWSEGTGICLRFLQESTGKRLSLTFVDPTAPEWVGSPPRWAIHAIARDPQGATLGHIVLLLADLRSATREVDSDNKDYVLGVSLGQRDFDARHPETAWSMNPGSQFRITLRKRENGDLEGDLQGQLVDNRKQSYLRIDSGYFYMKR